MKVGDLVSYFGISVVERRGIIIDVNPRYKFVQFPNGDLLAIEPRNLSSLSSLS